MHHTANTTETIEVPNMFTGDNERIEADVHWEYDDKKVVNVFITRLVSDGGVDLLRELRIERIRELEQKLFIEMFNDN